MAAGLYDSGSKLPQMLARMRALADRAVKVGILEDAGLHDNAEGALTVAEVAATHEYGAERIPERSFLRAGIDEATPRIKATLDALGKAVLDGTRTPDEAAARLGLLGVSIVQAKITDGPFTPNAPRTVAEKGSSRPLIDKGQLRQSIMYEIVDPKSLSGAPRGREGGS